MRSCLWWSIFVWVRSWKGKSFSSSEAGLDPKGSRRRRQPTAEVWNHAWSFFHEESVLDKLGPVVIDADHVEAHPPAETVVHLHIEKGSLYEMSLFPLVYGADRLAEACAVPFLDLDEDETASFFGDHIDLAQEVPVIPFDDPVPGLFQGFYGHILALESFFAVRQGKNSLTPLNVLL